MKWTKQDIDEIVLQARQRAERIAALEEKLEHERGMRAVDARWLVRESDLSRTAVAALCGISRVTLNDYLKQGGISAQDSAGDELEGQTAVDDVIEYRIDPVPVAKMRAD